MIPRLYTHYPFSSTFSIPLSPPQHHYLSKVMRLQKNDIVHIFNGTQGLWGGHLQDTILADLFPITKQPQADTQKTLFFSTIKQQNWLLEKATELGITDFFPIVCHRTVVRHFCHKRHMKIIHEACEQSHRLNIPILHELESLNSSFLEKVSEKIKGPLAVLQLNASTPIIQAHPKPAGIFIGPEGGWSPQENSLFSEKPHIRPIHLGSAVLRAETAALAASTVMMLHA